MKALMIIDLRYTEHGIIFSRGQEVEVELYMIQTDNNHDLFKEKETGLIILRKDLEFLKKENPLFQPKPSLPSPWTKTLPDKAGFYWYRGASLIMVMVYVFQDWEENWVGRICGAELFDIQPLARYSEGEWSGPIEPPLLK